MKPLIFTIILFGLTGCSTNTKNEANSEPKQMIEPEIISQEKITEMIIPILKERGITYRKFKKVFAKEAEGGEKISTTTSDGAETTNTAEPGDFIIKNQTEAQEMYIVKAEKFNQRYKFDKEAEDGFSEYHPLGKVLGLEINQEELTKLNLDKEFYFTAPWGEKMVAKENDFLVSPPDYSEIYRIARKEFFETYELDQN